jgi:YhcH/YjgK/YiaL family protein
MIYGNVNNKNFEQEIAVLPAPLKSAVRLLKDNDYTDHEPGKFEIELDGVPMLLQVLDLTTAPRESVRPEVHRLFVDVHFLVTGTGECTGYYDDDGTNEIDEDFLDTDRDICFYKNNPNAPEITLKMTSGSFGIYFPWDVHLPACQAGDAPENIRKIVMKVPLEACLK